jgi:DNA-binding NarL/FixJ family response regulator
MTATKRIWMVDDHVLIRQSLKELIERFDVFSVEKQFDSGQEFLDACETAATPDLVILDLSMPGMSGEQVMQSMVIKQIDVPVLFLTLNEDEDQIIRLFRMGARGYLKKNCSADQLLQALKDITERGYFHNEFLSLSLRKNGSENRLSGPDKILAQLSPREKQFLALVCHEKEYTYEQIADIMSVTVRTVDGYRESLFDKFGIKSKTGLVLFVLRHKLFEALSL